MDPFSHGLLGASVALTRAPQGKIAAAIICGLTAAMAPDLDILIRSSENPLLQIQYHRHFTHALAFAPIGGTIVAAALWPLLRRHISFLWIWLFAVMGYSTHGLLDAMTSYGTHLFWPFTDRRESWSIVSVVDPVVTAMLLTGVIMTHVRQNKKWAWGGILAFAAYLCFGWMQHETAFDQMQRIAAARGHVITAHEVKPTLLNSIVWRTNYISDGKIYNDGWHIGPFGHIMHYPGGTVPVLQIDRDFPTLNPNSVQRQDIDKFVFFSAGFAAPMPDDPMVIGDYRFALLPDDVGPLWGIRIDPQNSEQHAAFEGFRNVTDEKWAQFTRQLRGLPSAQN